MHSQSAKYVRKILYHIKKNHSGIRCTKMITRLVKKQNVSGERMFIRGKLRGQTVLVGVLHGARDARRSGGSRNRNEQKKWCQGGQDAHYVKGFVIKPQPFVQDIVL
eukprot:TRINITY_DN66674_c0_g1_i6.p3 TRINITY_DN66674_c0_g1~~TRINITY_DN66674_c0_g1_i6.p3  ORF type:complete len:107 (-),score=8.77 TRINITY_DN66674_c0_g1_i6:134-454(-)